MSARRVLVLLTRHHAIIGHAVIGHAVIGHAIIGHAVIADGVIADGVIAHAVIAARQSVVTGPRVTLCRAPSVNGLRRSAG